LLHQDAVQVNASDLFGIPDCIALPIKPPYFSLIGLLIQMDIQLQQLGRLKKGVSCPLLYLPTAVELLDIWNA
jgi:hypothetical protein